MLSSYMTVAEVADALGISTSGVYKLIQRGKLPAIRRSERGLRVSRLALDAYQRCLQRVGTTVPIVELQASTDELRAEFERQTLLSPVEWERRWNAGQIEDSTENMKLSIRALGLLLREQGEGSHASDERVEPVSAPRSAA